MDVKKKITDFLDFVETINEQYVTAQQQLEEAEKIEQDGLHYLEFVDEATPAEMANAARKLQQARRQRREAKDTVVAAAGFIDWCGKHGIAVYALRELLSSTLATDIPREERYYHPRTNEFTAELAETGKLPPPKPVIWIDKHGNESYFKSIASAARSLDIDRNDILACCRYQLDEIDGQRFRFYSDSLDARYKPDTIEEETPPEPEYETPAMHSRKARTIRLTSDDGDTLEYPSVSQAIKDLSIPSKSAVYKALQNGTMYKGFLWEYIS